MALPNPAQLASRRRVRIWAQLLGVVGTTIEKVELTDEQELVVSVRPDR